MKSVLLPQVHMTDADTCIDNKPKYCVFVEWLYIDSIGYVQHNWPSIRRRANKGSV